MDAENLTAEEAVEILHKKKRHIPWLLVALAVLGTACGGVTGLYSGSYITGASKDQVIKRQADENRKVTGDLTKTVDKLATTVQALQDKVQGVEKTAVAAKTEAASAASAASTAIVKADSTASTVAVVKDKVDKRALVGDHTRAIANKALNTAVLGEARNDIQDAKMQTIPPVVVVPLVNKPETLTLQPTEKHWLGGAIHGGGRK